MSSDEEAPQESAPGSDDDVISSKGNDSPFHKAFSKLISIGASWGSTKEISGSTVHSMSNVRYGESEEQTLDIYFPNDLVVPSSQENAQQDDQEPSTNISLKPVFIHIHGGGWSRGSKDNKFYGGPAMSQNAASFGCIAVASGYRLGLYPEFVHDAAAAIEWVQTNITDLGGDVNQVFLSGHSAGGHIASLLVLRHASFLEPRGIPRDFFKGLILVSGVYDLFKPLKTAPLDAKNKWFNLAYVYPAFGSNEKLKREASPLLLLDPDKDTSYWGTAVSFLIRRYSSTREKVQEVMDEGDNKEEEANDIAPLFEINTTHIPDTLIMNASFDMGLQENGQLMAAALEKHTNVKYVLISGTDHASICWNETAALEIKEFCLSKMDRKPKEGGNRGGDDSWEEKSVEGTL